MQIETISLDDAKAICLRAESHFYDRKGIGVGSAKIEKVAVAFANADGGEIVIGIDDVVAPEEPTKSWNGGENFEAFNAQIQALFKLVPSLSASTKFYACEKLPGIILTIAIEKSSSVHKTSDGTVYVRRNASSVPVTEISKIQELEYAKGVSSFEEEKVPKVLIDELVYSKSLANFLSGFSPKSENLDYVINEYLVDRKSWEPKYAGVLLFHDSPAAALSRKCSVKIIRYETKADDPERDNLKSTKTIEGPLYDLIQRSVEQITSTLSDVNIWTIDGMKKVSYPSEAIWELFVNAIIHRDYSISDDVQVFIFDNRIEIKSPGRLPGGITTNNILNERFTRNTKIVRTLARYQNPPNKDIGEGINTAFQKMKDWKLQTPTIEEDGNFVVVTIPHTPLARPEELVLEFIEKHGEITNKQGRDISGIKDANIMKQVFYRLRDAGRIEPVPERKGSASAWKKK